MLFLPHNGSNFKLNLTIVQQKGFLIDYFGQRYSDFVHSNKDNNVNVSFINM